MLSAFRDIRLKECQWILILVLISSPLYTYSIGSFNLYYIYTFLIVVAFLLTIIKGNRIRIKPSTRVFFILLAFVFLSDLLLAKDAFQSNKVMMLTLLILVYPSNKTTASLIYPTLACAGVVFGFYMLQHPQMVADVRLSVEIGDWVMDPNWAAIALFPTFCCGLSLIEKFSKKSVIGISLCLFSLNIVFLTGSRGAFLSLIVAVMAFLYYRMKMNGPTIVVLIVVALALYYITPYFFSSVDQELMDRYNGTVDDTGRSEIWHLVIEGFLNSNLFQMIFGHSSVVKDIGAAAHNIFLQQLYARGVLGLMLLLMFLYRIFKETLNNHNYIGLYLFFALMVSSFFTPIWGSIFMMMPFASIGYINNYLDQNKVYKI